MIHGSLTERISQIYIDATSNTNLLVRAKVIWYSVLATSFGAGAGAVGADLRVVVAVRTRMHSTTAMVVACNIRVARHSGPGQGRSFPRGLAEQILRSSGRLRRRYLQGEC